jgi:hypothetical protein
MKAAPRGLGRLCLVAVMCLVAWIGPSALPATAQDCADLIADGGFETGGVWQFGATPVLPEYVTDTVHTGDRSLALGITRGANTQSYSSARQVVMIPAGATQAGLSFWVYAEVGAQPGADKMQLLLLKPDGATLAILWTASTNNPNWSQLTYDLSPWRGQVVQVYFNVINDGAGGTTGMFLDDVSLGVCPDSALAAATAMPPVSGADEIPAEPLAAVTPSMSLDVPSDTPVTLAATPAAVLLTPESGIESANAEEGMQAAQTDSATQAASEPSPGSGTPALIFYTPTAQTAPATQATPEPSPGSGTPALIFFTPTADPALSPTAQRALHAGSGTLEAGAAGAATPELTRISLIVTPAWTFTPRPTRDTAVPLATRGSAAPQVPGEAPFAQWPRGWWFAVGAVFVIILAAGLVARRSS